MATNSQVLQNLIGSSKQILILQLGRLDDLSVKDFPQITSKQIIRLMHKIFTETLEMINTLEVELQAAKTKNDFKEIEKDLRLFTKFLFDQNEIIDMLESSTREKVSQNIVFLIKYFTEKFNDKFTNAKFFITPTYQHNFLIINWGERLQKYIEDLDIDIEDLPPPKTYFILSFPAVFKENIVSNSILGHELGHYLIQNHKKTVSTESPKIEYTGKFKKFIDDILNDIKRHQEITKSIPENFLRQEFEYYYNHQIKSQVEYGSEELLSDLIGFRLFGPVMLFAMFEFLLIDTPSHSIGNMGHPPPSLRIQTLIAELHKSGYLNEIKDPKLKKPIMKLIKNIENFIAMKPSDSKLEDLIKIEAWKSVIPKLKVNADDITRGMKYDKKTFGKDLPILIEKLSDMVPPCEINQGTPADLISILNAGMIFRLNWQKLIKKPETTSKPKTRSDSVVKIEPKIDTLVLRAAEQSVIENQFIQAYKGKKND